MPSRRKTREFVLQVLFAADSRNQDPLEVLDFLEKHFDLEPEETIKMDRVVKDFARELVSAVARDKKVIDSIIAKFSTNWKLYRINRVDRNILRMAIAEMTTFPDSPGPVILNEAIEIGKKYGAENSGAFINGILDRVQSSGLRPLSAVKLRQFLDKLDEKVTKV
ncbi:MAG: transcription antitermination factor NusB [Syntrophaceae bacterium]|nr:transcription antitermination factor NusB [Syntrophaceae bacterium]